MSIVYIRAAKAERVARLPRNNGDMQVFTVRRIAFL
ncbi:hypothetical protein bas07_0089 [Escherichia phage JakobBernoulli]|uniref:Uncharacterized protein n=1 Tax=Escherichia phage JakobBernoulli TaxID=2851971 RepID=A0AAE7VU94_9CAUD|nr:hypothetical protein bas07_0089 [Escherichia phage JakobBernoulli]